MLWASHMLGFVYWPFSNTKLHAALADLKEAIREADFIELGPHELVKHCSSMVLLSGTIYTAGRASSIPPVANSSSQSSPSVSGRLSGKAPIQCFLLNIKLSV